MFAAFRIESLQELCPLFGMWENSNQTANAAWHRHCLQVPMCSVSPGNWCCLTAAGVMWISVSYVKQTTSLILVSEIISAGAEFFLCFWCETVSHMLIAKHWAECLTSQGNFVWRWYYSGLKKKASAWNLPLSFLFCQVSRECIVPSQKHMKFLIHTSRGPGVSL